MVAARVSGRGFVGWARLNANDDIHSGWETEMPSISLPTALLIGAGVAGTAGIAGAALSSSAASDAADKQTAAANLASGRALDQFTTTNENLRPYRDAGGSGLNALMASLGLGGPGPNLLAANGVPGLTFQPTQAQLEATPGYQFTKAQGLQSVANSNAAAGRGISGAALKGAATFATGLADNTLKTQQSIFQSNLGNVLNPLANLANLGQTAATTTGQQGNTAVGNANALTVGGANAGAAGIVGGANAISGGLNSLGGQGLNYLLYSKLLGGDGGGSGGFYDGSNAVGSGAY